MSYQDSKNLFLIKEILQDYTFTDNTGINITYINVVGKSFEMISSTGMNIIIMKNHLTDLPITGCFGAPLFILHNSSMIMLSYGELFDILTKSYKIFIRKHKFSKLNF